MENIRRRAERKGQKLSQKQLKDRLNQSKRDKQPKAKATPKTQNRNGGGSKVFGSYLYYDFAIASGSPSYQRTLLSTKTTSRTISVGTSMQIKSTASGEVVAIKGQLPSNDTITGWVDLSDKGFVDFDLIGMIQGKEASGDTPNILEKMISVRLGAASGAFSYTDKGLPIVTYKGTVSAQQVGINLVHPKLITNERFGDQYTVAPVYKLKALIVDVSEPCTAWTQPVCDASKHYDFAMTAKEHRGTHFRLPVTGQAGDWLYAIRSASGCIRLWLKPGVAEGIPAYYTVTVSLEVETATTTPSHTPNTYATTGANFTTDCVFTTQRMSPVDYSGSFWTVRGLVPPRPGTESGDSGIGHETLRAGPLNPVQVPGGTDYRKFPNTFIVKDRTIITLSDGVQIFVHRVEATGETLIYAGSAFLNDTGEETGGRHCIVHPRDEGVYIQCDNLVPGSLVRVTEYVPLVERVTKGQIDFLGITMGLSTDAFLGSFIYGTYKHLFNVGGKTINCMVDWRAKHMIKWLRENPDSVINDPEVRESITSTIGRMNPDAVEITDMIEHNNNGIRELAKEARTDFRYRGSTLRDEPVRLERTATAEEQESLLSTYEQEATTIGEHAKSVERVSQTATSLREVAPTMEDVALETSDSAASYVAKEIEAEIGEVSGSLEGICAQFLAPEVVLPVLAVGTLVWLCSSFDALNPRKFMKKTPDQKTQVITAHPHAYRQSHNGHMLFDGKAITHYEATTVNFLLGRGPPHPLFVHDVLCSIRDKLERKIILPSVFNDNSYCDYLSGGVTYKKKIEVHTTPLTDNGADVPSLIPYTGEMTTVATTFLSDLFKNVDCKEKINMKGLNSGLFGVVRCDKSTSLSDAYQLVIGNRLPKLDEYVNSVLLTSIARQNLCQFYELKYGKWVCEESNMCKGQNDKFVFFYNTDIALLNMDTEIVIPAAPAAA